METERIARFLDKIRPWPWKQIFGITVTSFLLASLVSMFFGWFLMSRTERPAGAPDEMPLSFVHQMGASDSAAAMEKILARNIFNSEGLIGEDDGTGGGERIAKTQLPIKVLGIIYGGTPYNGIAMVENSQSHSINSFMVGDQLTPEAKVIEIQLEQILIDNQGRREFAAIEEVELRRSTRKGGGKRKSNTPESLTGSGYASDAPPENFKEEGFERKGTNIEVSAEYKSRLLTTDFANVLQDAKASPNMVDGVLKGWRMDKIRRNSFYEKSGMQNGDVVEEINGVVLSDAGQSIKLLQSLRNEGEIDIKINRSGQKMNLNLKVR
jgi:type II secretion system protein C